MKVRLGRGSSEAIYTNPTLSTGDWQRPRQPSAEYLQGGGSPRLCKADSPSRLASIHFPVASGHGFESCPQEPQTGSADSHLSPAGLERGLKEEGWARASLSQYYPQETLTRGRKTARTHNRPRSSVGREKSSRRHSWQLLEVGSGFLASRSSRRRTFPGTATRDSRLPACLVPWSCNHDTGDSSAGKSTDWSSSPGPVWEGSQTGLAYLGRCTLGRALKTRPTRGAPGTMPSSLAP